MPDRSRTARARGKNHAAALIATALLVLAPAPVPAQDAPAAVSFTQRGVPAEATAENAVIARERALAAGRRAAWERIAAATGASRTLSDAQIEAMVSSIIIEEERTTPTRYAGRITVNFNPARARAMTGGAGVAEGGAAPPGAPAGEGTAQPRPPAAGPAVATVEAVALYGSLEEWLELRRRLRGGAARIEVIAISTDRARLRLGLRTAPGAAAEDFARQGVSFVPGSGAPGDAWRVGLAGRS
ncbi:hypothetical protein FHS88_001400 [Roseomonas alkaliterrae]|uniref:SPOR domain-containing protein n=3 Tax=Neoroseomonas alkaliterrae TaxID=1452450 RepID=A0A840XKY9_9PROT|nr:hypothetical protein [Neoroseomonas alkaliterrae]MBB5689275.1 hypothetical protein [Neoroseomonas alkaliterrae]